MTEANPIRSPRWRLHDYLDLGIVGATHGLSDGFAGMLKPILALIVVDLGLSTIDAGVLLSVFSISTFLFLYPISLFADNRGHKVQILIAGMTVAALAFFSMRWSASFAAIALLAFLAGAGNATFHPCGTALVAERFPQRRAVAVSVYSMMGNGGAAIIPVVLAAVAVNFDWRTGIAVCSAPALVLLPVMWTRFRDSSPAKVDAPQQSLWRGMLAISRQATQNRSVVILAAVYALAGMGTGLFSGFLSLLAVNRFNIGVGTVGLLLSCYFLAGLFSKPLMGYLYTAWGVRPALLVPMSVSGLLVVVLALTTWSLILFPLVILIGIAVPISPIILTAAAELSNRQSLASSVGLIYTSHGLSFISPVIGGWLAQQYGLGASYLFAALLFWGAGLIAIQLRPASLAIVAADYST